MPIYRKQRGDRWYLYEQKSVREGKRVRTISRYLGPVDTFDAAQDRAYDSAMRQAKRDYPEQFEPKKEAPPTVESTKDTPGSESGSAGDTGAEGQGE